MDVAVVASVSVFPAYAGMIPNWTNENRTATSVPRIRGDDPYGCALFFEDKRVFPAYAGMIPTAARWLWRTARVPRIRGDDPTTTVMAGTKAMCSPHTRG